MGAIFDLMLSLLIGAAILGIILAASANIADEQASQAHEVHSLEALVSSVDVLEFDLQNIGAGVPDSVLKVREATQNSVRFLRSRNSGAGTFDTVSYYTGPTSEVTRTTNANDKYLYRRVNSTIERVGVVTDFVLNYLAAGGATLPLPVPSDRLSEVNGIEVTMEVQSPEPVVEGTGPSAIKRYSVSRIERRRFETRNLKR